MCLYYDKSLETYFKNQKYLKSILYRTGTNLALVLKCYKQCSNWEKLSRGAQSNDFKIAF